MYEIMYNQNQLLSKLRNFHLHRVVYEILADILTENISLAIFFFFLLIFKKFIPVLLTIVCIVLFSLSTQLLSTTVDIDSQLTGCLANGSKHPTDNQLFSCTTSVWKSQLCIVINCAFFYQCCLPNIAVV